MAFKGLVITRDGLEILAKAQQGAMFKISQIKIGDGSYTGDHQDMHNMAHALYGINPVMHRKDNNVYLDVDISSNNQSGYYFREIGIFVKDGADKDVLYAYDNAGDDAEFIVPIDSGVAYEKRLRFCLTMSNDIQVTLTTEGTIYTLQSDFEVARELLNMHIDSVDIHVTKTDKEKWNDANARKHDHANKSILDKITQVLLDSWSSAYTHISDAVKHITDTERNRWNNTYTKAEADAKDKTINDSLVMHKNDAVSHVTQANKNTWADKYTKNEVDNKFATLETSIDWKESVATFTDIAKTYPTPVDGWTVNVKDTDYTYRYSGTAWVAISANAISKATASVDGLLTKEDKVKLDENTNQRHSHPNKPILDGITQVLMNSWNTVSNKLDKTGDASNTTNAFTQAASRANLVSGEKLSLSLGKLMKWFADLKAVAFSGAYNDLINKPLTFSPTIGETSSTAYAGNRGKAVEDKVSDLTNPNLLINGDFQIWQRGSSFPTALSGEYTADRWAVFAESKTTKINVRENSGRLLVNGDGTSRYIVHQRIDWDDSLINRLKMYDRKLCFSFQVLSSVVVPFTSLLKLLHNSDTNLDITLGTTTVNTVANKSTHISCTCTIPSNVDFTQYRSLQFILCNVQANIKDNLYFYWAKVEYGTVLTPFVPLCKSEEQDACRLYTQVYDAAELRLLQYFNNGLAKNWCMNFIKPMRIAPTITGTWDVYDTKGQRLFQNTSLSVVGKGVYFARFLKDVESPSGITYIQPSSRIILDAEIY